MITREPKIILEGISVDDFFTRFLEIKTVNNREEFTGDENMTVDEAAKFLKLSAPTIHRLKAANKIPFTKVGARVIYRRSQLIAWMNQKSNGPQVQVR